MDNSLLIQLLAICIAGLVAMMYGCFVLSSRLARVEKDVEDLLTDNKTLFDVHNELQQAHNALCDSLDRGNK